MLRRMLGLRRQPEEDFVHFIRRSTAQARRLYHRWGFQSITTLVLKAIFRMASHMSHLSHEGRANDAPATSLQFFPATLMWRNQDWWVFYQTVCLDDPDCRQAHWRHTRPGRSSQWEDVFVTAFGTDWSHFAKQSAWGTRWSKFQQSAYNMASAKPPEEKYAEAKHKKQMAMAPPAKRPRHVCDESLPWEAVADDRFRIEILGDSLLVVNWMRGVWRANCKHFATKVAACIRTLERLHCSSGLEPRSVSADIHRHIFRELNVEADALANEAHSKGTQSWQSNGLRRCRFYRAFFDGSKRGASTTGAWILYGSQGEASHSSECVWMKLAWSHFPVDAASSTGAELEAALSLHGFIDGFFSK